MGENFTELAEVMEFVFTLAGILAVVLFFLIL